MQLFSFFLYAKSSLELFLLGVDLHGERLIPFELSLLDEERCCFEFLAVDGEFDVGALFNGLEGDCLNDCCLDCAFRSMAIIFQLGLFLFILADFDDG